MTTIGTQLYQPEGFPDDFQAQLEDEPHARPGQFCPTCDGVHCSRPEGHEWNDDLYCVWCGADGAA